MRGIVGKLNEMEKVNIEYKGKGVALFLPSVNIESVLMSMGTLNIELEDGIISLDLSEFSMNEMEENSIILKKEEGSYIKIFEIIT